MRRAIAAALLLLALSGCASAPWRGFLEAFGRGRCERHHGEHHHGEHHEHHGTHVREPER